MGKKRSDRRQTLSGTNKGEQTSLGLALDALEAPTGQPTDDDAPPISTFPMTRAARAALDYEREKKKAMPKREPM